MGASARLDAAGHHRALRNLSIPLWIEGHLHSSYLRLLVSFTDAEGIQYSVRIPASERADEHLRWLPRIYFNLSETLASAAFAQAASLSPPGAPLTATAPLVASPTLIGTPPWALIVPGSVAGGAAVPGGRGWAGPEGRL